MASIAIFTSLASIFLPRYSGVRPTIRPGDEHRDDGEQQHAVEARADAAEDDLAELDVEQRHQPAERREAVVHRIDRAARGVGRHRGEQGRIGDAEADFLALHVAAGLSALSAGRCQAGEGRIAGLRPVGDDDAGQEQDAMTAKIAQPWRWLPTMRPNMLVRPAPIEKISTICTKLVSGFGILERMGGVGVEEAAAVGAEHLDDFLRSHRSLGDHLLGAFERRRLGIGAEILRHALPDEEQADDDRDRQQDVERAAGQIDPEIADRLRPSGARSRGSARRRARCRSRPRRNCAP